MESKNPKDTKTLSSRCLALVFKEKKTKSQSLKPNDSQESEAKSSVKSPESLFEEFVKENAKCYWNPHLEESVKNLKYEGHIQPYTLLATGRDIYLDTIKGAWTRKAVRCPQGLTLHRLGEVLPVEMNVVHQTQFTPLPEALCIIISELTKTNKDASFDAILDCLKDTYRGMQQPSEPMVYETLGELIKERKIYHTGCGYHILSPDLFQPGGNAITLQDHHLVIGGGETSNGIAPTIYIPLMNSNTSADMVSISCQTEISPDTKCNKDSKATEKDGKLDKSIEKEDKSKSKFDRTHSLRESKKNKKEKETFPRTASMRYGDDKTKGQEKDINLKSSDLYQDKDKDKGEKSSLLSKLFGRNKSAKDTANSTAVVTETRQIEYATFSAQFPPPELQWYENQVSKIIRPQMPHPSHHGAAEAREKSRTWHHMHHRPMVQDAEVQSEMDDLYDEICVHANDCPVSKAQTLPADLGRGPGSPEDTMPKFAESFSSQSDSWSSLSDLPEKPPLNHHMVTKPKARPVRHRPKIRERDRSSGAYDGYQDNHSAGNAHVRTKDSAYQFNSDLSTSEDQSRLQAPAQLNNAAAAYSTPERPSHVTKVFKKYRQMKCPSVYNNNISVENGGKASAKNKMLSMSRDSGVNCVGLVKQDPKQHLFGKNHYNATAEQEGDCGRKKNESGQQNGFPEHARGNNVKSNLASGLWNHEALIHAHPGASPEDSGFNSPKAYYPAYPTTPGSDYQRPQASTPNDLSPDQQYEMNPTDENWYSNQDPHDPPSYNHHHHYHHHHYAPDDDENLPLSSDGRYQNQGESFPQDFGKVQSEGSATNLWSDTSEQTVREVLPPQAQQHQPAESATKRSSSSPPETRSMNEVSPMRQVVVRSEPFREIHLVPDNVKNVRSSHGHLSHHSHRHDKPSKISHHRSPTKDEPKRQSKMRNDRTKPAPSHRPVSGSSEGERRRQAIGRCPIRNYPSENSAHVPNGYNHHGSHQKHQGDSEDGASHRKRDFSVVGVI